MDSISLPRFSVFRRGLYLSASLVLLAVAYRTPLQIAGRWHNTDESLYAAGVAFYNEGNEPLQDCLPTAGNRPLHFAVYWLCDTLFGHYPWLALDVAHSIIIGASAWLVATACATLIPGMSPRIRGLVGICFILHSYPFNQGLTNNSEHIANLLQILFFCLWVRGGLSRNTTLRLLSFVALGLAVGVKRQQIPLVMCAPLFWFIAPTGKRTPLAFGLEMAGAAVLFILPNIVTAWWISQPLGGATSIGLRYFLGAGFDLGRTLYVIGLYILEDPIALGGLIVAACVLIGAAIDRYAPRRLRLSWQLRLASVYFLLALVSVLPGLRLWRHYFLLTAPAGFVLLTVATCEAFRAGHLRRRFLVVSLAVLLFLQNDQIIANLRGRDSREIKDAAAVIQAHSSPDDRIFVWGWMPELYSFSNRVPASRYVFCAFVVNDLQIPTDQPAYDVERLDALLKDLEIHRPALFVIVKRQIYTKDGRRYDLANVPRLKNYVETNFSGSPILETDDFVVRVRRRNEAWPR